MKKWILLLACLLLTGVPARAEDARDLHAMMDAYAVAVETDGWSDAYEDEIAALGEKATLFLLGADGAIVERTSDQFLQGHDTARFFLSRYRHAYSVNGEAVMSGVALLVDERGNAQSAYRAIHSPDPVGEDDEAYAFYFPDIGEEVYERGQWYYDELGGLTGDLWYYLESEFVLGKKARLQVVDYINWERDLLELNFCPDLVYRSLSEGKALVLILGVEE